jgi:hypothetical protein
VTMTGSTSDAQYDEILRIATELSAQYSTEDVAWRDSPFRWIRGLPSRRRGAIAEVIVDTWLRRSGFDVQPSPDSDADRIVSGKRVEIKSSTLWAGGFYKFQQIRDQNYEIALCFGMSPLEAHFWALRKELLIQGWGVLQGLSSQHGGQTGRDTAWLQVYPQNPPQWLDPHGGSLSDGLRALRDLV